MIEHVFIENVTPNDKQAAARAIERLFSQFPPSALPQAGMHVLLKPNLLAKHAPEKAVTTHPDVLYGVVKALHKRNVTNITLADSPGGPHTKAGMQAIYRGCRLEALCKELGVRMNVSADGGKLTCGEGRLVREFTVLEAVLQADYILNLPKLKTHVLTGMSGACKNLFGCVPGLLKAEFHMRFPEREHFGEMLVDLCEGIKPGLHLMDGILGMEGDGPAGGTPRETGVLLASQNAHLLDLSVCHLMGLAPQTVPTLAAAIGRGLCAKTLEPHVLKASSGQVPVPFEQFCLPASMAPTMDFSRNVPPFMRRAAAWFAAFSAPHPVVKRAECIRCKKCMDICPVDAIELKTKAVKISKAKCIRCFCCHEMCPVKAISVKTVPLYRI